MGIEVTFVHPEISISIREIYSVASGDFRVICFIDFEILGRAYTSTISCTQYHLYILHSIRAQIYPIL